ncbi:unnamed protein product [Fraxinus pennsylvanica]|uniref:Uncharacterized protein n=1 Tax=Fraxinus pennsylvanica TaxID=56036 RepID=A0AAD1Z873_9LAMI|nr:unnamed protein product [Fraxinus pennsylvanica]
MISLSLFDDLLIDEEQPPLTPPPPLQPQTHKKVRLFGVCISPDENIHPNSLLSPPPQTHINPYSNPNLKRLFQDINPQHIFLPNKRLVIRESDPAIAPYSSPTMSQSTGTIVQKKRKLRAKGIIVRNEPEPFPELLPPRILQQIQCNGGTQPIFLFKKMLTPSDVESGENRLFLSRKEKPIRKLMEFLTEAERNEVERDGVEAPTIDPKGDHHVLELKRWPSVPIFVLKKEWSKLVRENKLEKYDWIQLWGFRQNSTFRLAFNIKKAGKKGIQGDDESSSGGGSNLEGSGSSDKGNNGGDTGSSSGGSGFVDSIIAVA